MRRVVPVLLRVEGGMMRRVVPVLLRMVVYDAQSGACPPMVGRYEAQSGACPPMVGRGLCAEW